MKKVEFEEIKFNQSNLYVDDLVEIEHILINELKVEKLTITFNEYESETVADIPIDTDSINEITFSTNKPYVHIKIGGYDPRIWSSTSSILIIGTMSKIAGIIKKREKKLITRIYKISTNTSLMLASASSMLLAYRSQSIEGIGDYGSNVRNMNFILLTVFLIAFVLWIYLIKNPIKSNIYFTSKKQKPGFWKKNKDQIIVNLLVALFTFVITFTGSALLR